MTFKDLILVLVCLMIIAGPVSASTITAENVGSYSINANPGYVFYKIKVSDLPIGTNQSHILYYNGQPFLLTIKTWKGGGWVGDLQKNAEISLTMPNGSVQTSVTAANTIVGSYTTIIQPTFRPDSSVLESATAMFLTVDLNIGLVPASAQFSTAPMGYNPESSLPFTAASGTFTDAQRANVYVYQVTTQEFIDTIQTYNPGAGIGDLGSAVFQWTWNGVLGFLNMIPVIGPIVIALLDVMGVVLTELLFWITFLVENFPAILCGIETLIVMMAAINAGKGKRSMGRFAGNIYRYNIAMVTGMITLIETARLWAVSFIELAAKVVEALKPI